MLLELPMGRHQIGLNTASQGSVLFDHMKIKHLDAIHPIKVIKY